MTVKPTKVNLDDEEGPVCLCPVSFVEARHLEVIEGESVQAETWRMKERMKTVSVALVLCLNIGVDPPDVVKPQPCARLECWLDPLGLSQQKALETIGTALQKLYERWQPRARYKLSLDPTVEDVKKLCTSLRRNAKDERVLFHYNGHGVPRPTKNGEIWVFNKSYTQYIPLSIFDLQTWMGAPSIFVWDCNCAGQIVESFKQFGEQHEKEFSSTTDYHRQHNGAAATVVNNIHQDSRKSSVENLPPGACASSANEDVDDYASPSSAAPNFRECIQLGACRADQVLPTNAELPCDLFTSCLTTPIKTAILWYILQNNLSDKIPLDIVDKIPGQLTERRTLLGELNWIFTAITDTIAWHVLPRDLFQKLFRQDLLVASLFRNFLLADRLMRSYNCMPVSSPELPPTHEHSMWQAWDFALDVCLNQLLHAATPQNGTGEPPTQLFNTIPPTVPPASVALVDVNSVEYTHSPFFAIQLTAFEVWLQYGYNRREPPLQLPIVLQVLLSQVHRIRALELLGRFLDLGSWAVSLALSVGIFPYVLKLLQSSAKELRPLLSFIWAKILAVDAACQQDLIKDGGHRYFLQILSDPSVNQEQKVISAFVLASILEDYTAGQEAIMQGGFISICLDLLNNDCKCSMLRRWIAIGLGRLWSDFDAARWQAIRCLAYEKMYELLADSLPEVRASAVYALGTLISNQSAENEHATLTDHSIAANLVQKVSDDASPLVRQELVVALHWLLLNFKNQFVTLAYEINEEKTRTLEKKYKNNNNADPEVATSPSAARRYHRQSSLGIADNLLTSNLLAGRVDDKTDGSTQNLQSLLPPQAPKLTAVGSFTKLFGLGSGQPTVAAGSKSNLLSPGVQEEHLDTKFRSMSFASASVGGVGATTNIYTNVWRTITRFCDDSHPDVSSLAQTLVDHVNGEVMLLKKTKMEAEHQNFTDNRSISAIMEKSSVAVPRKVSNISISESPAATSSLRPTFVVGSPADAMISTSKSATTTTTNVIESATGKRTRLLTPRMGDEGPTISVYSTIFTSPRRPVFGSGPAKEGSEVSPAPKRTGRKPPLIETKFLPWCCRRFTEPILHFFDENRQASPIDDCAREMPMYEWAAEMSSAMDDLCAKEKRAVKKSARLDLQLFVNRNNNAPLCLEFYPMHPLLCVGDAHHVSVWNWEMGHLVNTMLNHSPLRTDEKISYVKVINPLTQSFLMTGTNTGEVRVWDCSLSRQQWDYRRSSIYGAMNTARLVTSWNSRSSDAHRMWSNDPSTCYYWEQDSALLFVAGDMRCVRLWDAHCETKVQEIAVNLSECSVKSISADTNGHHILAVGCSDGTVRLLDRRLPTPECRVMTLRDLSCSVLNVCVQPKAAGSHVIAGSVDGAVRVWDPRMFRDPVKSFRLGDGNVTAMDVHPTAELVSMATMSHKVFTSNLDGQSVGCIQHHEGFMGQRMVDVNCLKFHPYRTNLAIGSVDCFLAMYGLC